MICLLTFAANRGIMVAVNDITHPAKREKGNIMEETRKTISATASDAQRDERIAELMQTAIDCLSTRSA